MKTRNTIAFLLVALLLTITSCRDIAVTTKINRNGSFTRTITVTGDSTEILNKRLPYPVDGSWKTVVKQDTAGSKWIITYTKTFRNDQLLNKEITSDTGWMKQLKRQVSIHKRFAFFYSYITFREKIEAANPFTKIPLKDSLSADEIKQLENEGTPATPADSTKMKDIEEKALLLVVRSMTAEVSEILEKGIRQLNDPGLSPQIVKRYQDSLFQKIGGNWNLKSSKDFIKDLAHWSGQQKILEIEKNSPGLFRAFDAKLAFFNEVVTMRDYTQVVEMPGLITETNSQSLAGNTVKWKVDPMSYLLTDYTMYVQSRVVNYWMFVLTGIVVLSLIILLVIRAYR